MCVLNSILCRDLFYVSALTTAKCQNYARELVLVSLARILHELDSDSDIKSLKRFKSTEKQGIAKIPRQTKYQVVSVNQYNDFTSSSGLGVQQHGGAMECGGTRENGD